MGVGAGFGSSLDWEIIIVDDASPDGTQEVARQLQGLYGEDRVVGVLLTRCYATGSLSSRL